jgi:hypothetical protein
MKIFVSEVVQRQDTVVCNKCGKSINSDSDEFEYIKGFEIIMDNPKNKYIVGKVSFDLCQECIEKIIGEFTIPEEREILF